VTDDVVLHETTAQKWRRRILKNLIRLGMVVVVYVGLVLLARILHRKVLYQPPDGEVAAGVPQGSTLLTTRASDGVAVNALVFATPKPKRTIVHWHGNAETVDDNQTLARELVKKGFDVVLVEYRGYGRSRGTSPDEQALYLDAEAILESLAARGVGPDRVVLWGQAIGAGVATEMALRGRGARLVLVAPFTSTLDLASRVVPFLPLGYVMIDRFDNLAKAPKIETPTLVVHGDIDDAIPFEQGERLSKAFPHAQFLKVTEGRHDNLYKNVTALQTMTAHAGS
jgi:hypothetical protein